MAGTAALALRKSILSCKGCELHKVGSGPVSFRGVRSNVMVVGEAPGRTEDENGRPFIGPAGKLLWEELSKVGIDPKEIFTTNAVCCFPDRTPTREETFACRSNLWNQLAYCNPKWVLALGNTANGTLGCHTSMGQCHGQWYEQRLTFNPERRFKVFPTYHPAAILRNRALVREWREDLRAFAEVAHAEEEA